MFVPRSMVVGPGAVVGGVPDQTKLKPVSPGRAPAPIPGDPRIIVPSGLVHPGADMTRDDPKLVGFLADYRPTDSLAIEVAGPDVTIVDGRGRRKSWHPNAKPTQEAQMEGGVIVFSAKWKGKALVLERSTPELITVRREFRLLDGGDALEVKAVLVRWRRSEERRYVYTRSK